MVRLVYRYRRLEYAVRTQNSPSSQRRCLPRARGIGKIEERSPSESYAIRRKVALALISRPTQLDDEQLFVAGVESDPHPTPTSRLHAASTVVALTEQLRF